MVDEGMISIHVSEIERTVVFEVSDNGLGMPQNVLENLLSTEPVK